MRAIAGTAEMASATLKNADGETVGTMSLKATPNGTLVHAMFTKLTPGVHAFHVHSIGKCVPPFTSAGGHYNPHGMKHGLYDPVYYKTLDKYNKHYKAYL